MAANRAFRRGARAVVATVLAGLTQVAVLDAADAAEPGATAPHTKSTTVEGLVITAARRPGPTDTPPSLEAYATPARYEQMSLSPDGGQLAFITSTNGMRLLIARRLGDSTVRAVKLDDGEVSAMSWADADHILLTTSRSALRGTCNAGDEQAIQIKVISENAALDSLSGPSPMGQPQTGPSPSSAAVQSAIRNLQTDRQGSAFGHPCVYYGVRTQSAVTEVDLNRRTGRTLGRIAGDYDNRPLGAPTPATLAGKPALVGPFLELRDRPQADQPVERVYLWNIDPKGGLSRIVNDGGGDIERRDRYVDDWLVTPQGEIVARSLYDFRAGAFVIQMRVKGAWRPVLTRPILAREHSFAPFLVGRGQGDASVVILDAARAGDANPSQADTNAVSAAGRTYHYYELSADGALTGPLEPIDAASDRPILAPDTGRVAGFVSLGADYGYAMRDAQLQSLYQLALDAVPGETVHVVAVAADPRQMILYATGQEDPGAYYLVDFAKGAHREIGDDYPQIPTQWYAAQTEITYPAADGMEIHALVTLPRKAKAQNLPVVVLPHDGLQAHERLGFDWLAQALSSRGYLVLQPDVRGSDGHGRAYQAAGLGQLGRKSVSDLADGVRFLAAQGLVDTRRACVLGIGWGGYQALVAAETSPAWRCAGAINAVSDPATYAAWLADQQVKPEQDQITALAADPQWPRAFAPNAASPGVVALYAGADTGAPSAVKAAGSLGVPVLLVSAKGDKIVPPSQGNALRDALLAAHKDVQAVAYGGADHALAGHDARLATLTAVLDFLAKADPAD